ncbi:MAG: ADOP family duplicated permease [Bryobacteraceae bacterium]
MLKIPWWLKRKSRDEELDREIRSHLDLEAEEQQERGLSPEQARYAAKRALGNPTQIKESVRATWRWTGFERIAQDLRFASRIFRKNRAFTAIAVISLAIAIGVNTAMFSILDAWLFRLLPYPNANRIVTLTRKHRGGPRFFALYRDFRAWQKHSHSFEQIAGGFWRSFTVSGDRPQEVQGMIATANLFQTLGVRPVIGRTFLPSDLRGPAVVVIGYGFWQQHFGGSSDALGKILRLNGKPYQIIGVIPKNRGPRLSNSPGGRAVYTLIPTAEDEYRSEGEGPIAGIARLSPGVSPAEARAELNAIQKHIDEQYKDEPKGAVAVIRLQDANTRTIRPSLFLVAGAVLFILLMVCANLASLLTGRAIERRREMAVRSALGSGRRRLIQQLITENVLLALLGTALGIFVAFAAIHAFVALNPLGVLPQTPITLDGRAILFTAVLAIAAAALFGFVPALEASRLNLNDLLKGESRSYSGNMQAIRIRSGLVVAQLAISFSLLIGCALMLGTLERAEHQALGFRAQGLGSVSIEVPPAIANNAGRRIAFYRNVLENVNSIPGVTAAGLTNIPALNNPGSSRFAIEGRPTPSSLKAWPNAGEALVTLGYFVALDLPLLKGRKFSEYDTKNSQPVVILNEAAARKWFGLANPLGKRIRLHGEKIWRTIVGVAGNAESRIWSTPGWQMASEMYIPQDQSAKGRYNTVAAFVWVYIRSRTPLSRNTVKAALRRVNPPVPTGQFQTMAESIASTERQPRLRTTVLTGAAALALLLAVLGIYGVVSQSVVQRKREIGIRIAMGALSSDILRLVLRQALRLALFGVAAGALCAFLLSRTLSSFLYGVAPTSAWIWLAAVFVLLGAMIAAALIPARRAAKVDPMTALRYE